MSHLWFALPVFCILSGCAFIKSSYNIQAGVSWGGIIEDSEIDAVTGATNLGVGLGVHPIIHIGRSLVETGFDFLTYNQSWTYTDAGEMMMARGILNLVN